MTIGIDIRNIGKKRTGDEVVFFELVRALAALEPDGKRYTLLTDIEDTQKLADIEKKLGITGKEDFRIVSLGKSNKFLWNLWTLPRYVRKHPLDIYHTQYVTPFFVPRKIKIITHIHDVSFKVYKKLIGWKDLFFLDLLIPQSLRRADHVIAVSEFTKNEIIQYYDTPKEKISVVYNAVAHNQELGIENQEKVRKKYNLPEKYILSLGSMQPRKNIPFLIKAFARIAHKIPHTDLVIAGKKAHHFDEKIIALLKESSLHTRIHFSGYIDENDKATVFAGAHIFAFPSLYEGFGMPLLEAMSVQTPVIASDIIVHREISGEGALFAPASDIDRFSEKLYDISSDELLRERLSRQGTARVELFSWGKSALLYRGILDRITQ